MHSTVRDYVIDYETARKLVKQADDRSQLKDMANNPNMRYLLRVRIHRPNLAMVAIQTFYNFHDLGLN
jgi:hypothetical protein